MRRALGIALGIHLCLLLVAGYIYVLPPGKREALFRAILQAEKIMPKKEVRTAPKKELKKAPAVRPLRRERPIELIAVKRAIASEFTVQLPEISGAVYSPQLALVPIPEPTVAERLPSFWERQIELKQREIRLESFGVTSLKPLGTAENPITRLLVQIIEVNTGAYLMVGVFYPKQRLIASHLHGEGVSMNIEVMVGPFIVPPEQVVFSLTRHGAGERMFLSTDSEFCHRTRIGINMFKYEWEDSPGGDYDYNDVVMIVTFIGAQSG